MFTVHTYFSHVRISLFFFYFCEKIFIHYFVSSFESAKFSKKNLPIYH